MISRPEVGFHHEQRYQVSYGVVTGTTIGQSYLEKLASLHAAAMSQSPDLRVQIKGLTR